MPISVESEPDSMVVNSMIDTHGVRAGKDNRDKRLHSQTLMTSLT